MITIRRSHISILYFALILFSNIIHASHTEIETKIFEKTRFLKEDFTNDEENYFWNISDMCCDDENNLYVADAGWNKIFKFDSKGDFLLSYGNKGEGPGEFRSGTIGGGLRICSGNDGNIYVADFGNMRLSIFNRKGEFLKDAKAVRASTPVNFPLAIYCSKAISKGFFPFSEPIML